MDIWLAMIRPLYFILPAYLANSSPVIFKNVLKSLAKPIDFGIKIKGKEIFGSHKTFRGLIMASVVGIFIFLLQKYLYQYYLFQDWSIIDYNGLFSRYSILPGFLMGAGAIFGDLVKSFFKRRANIKPGARWIPWDQLDFLIGALVFISFIYVPPWQAILVLLIITPILHISLNHLAFYLKIRGEKW